MLYYLWYKLILAYVCLSLLAYVCLISPVQYKPLEFRSYRVLDPMVGRVPSALYTDVIQLLGGAWAESDSSPKLQLQPVLLVSS